MNGEFELNTKELAGWQAITYMVLLSALDCRCDRVNWSSLLGFATVMAITWNFKQK